MDDLKACPFNMETERIQKESFRFEYTNPSLDWYEIVKVEIQPSEYALFKLELRFGNTWWLVGMNPPKSDYKPSYLWDETDIGRIGSHDIIRFIKWAEVGYNGNRLNEIKAISSSLNIVNEVTKLVKEIGRAEDGK